MTHERQKLLRALHVVAALGACELFVAGARADGVSPASASVVPTRASSDADARGRAERRYQEGVSAYRAGHYKDAIDAFRDADAALPSAALSYNTALAYDRLFDVAGALAAYRDYARRAADAPNMASVKARIHELERALMARGIQQLSVFSEPGGATVSIDGVPRGVTPWTGELPPEKHTILLTLRGYESAQSVLDLAKDRAADLTLSLSASTASAPANATSARAAAPKPTNALSREAKPAHPLGIAPWLTLGAGGSLLMAAAGFEIARHSAADSARHATTQLEYADRLASADSRQASARWLAASGGVLLLASGVMLYVNYRTSPEREVQLGLDGDRYLLSYRSRF